MPENSGNINAGGDIGAISGVHPSKQEVRNAINQLPEAHQAGLSGIEEVLEQLEAAVEGDDNLQPEAKTEALERVKVLAEAGKNPQAQEKRFAAQTAIEDLKGMINKIPGVPTLVGTWERVLPEIKELFGLE